jgi:regulator of replication initiation timing
LKSSAAAGDQEVSGEIEDLRAELASAEERIQDLEAENERLREQTQQQGEALEPLSSYKAFLEDDDVQEVIEEAKDEEHPSDKYHRGIMTCPADSNRRHRWWTPNPNIPTSGFLRLQAEEDVNGGPRTRSPRRRRVGRPVFRVSRCGTG